MAVVAAKLRNSPEALVATKHAISGASSLQVEATVTPSGHSVGKSLSHSTL